jgi:DNA-binding CsgD family transcriptional regulator
MTDENGSLRWILVVALLSIIIGGSIDLLLDQPARWLSFHVIFELLMITGALTMATSLWLGWRHAQLDVRRLKQSLHEHEADRDRWRQSAQHALSGFAVAIDEQFARWNLTTAEREVAILLLKGHSHKAIARVTRRSDATVRQHAAAVYHKAGLAGRATLAAYFLDGLTFPAPESLSPGHAR